MEAQTVDELVNFNPEKEFFIIDSNQLADVKTSLYGFCIHNYNIISGTTEKLDKKELNSDGNYIYIQKDNNNITIKQDYLGSYGIYLYKNNDYFALSNSFQYLVNHIKNSHKITLNNDYANMFLSQNLCSFSPSETLINEIKIVPRNTIILIDIEHKTLTLEYIDYEEHSIEPDSQEGLQILDNWYNKWTQTIHNIKADGYCISTDLSGGFDSRLTLPLILGASINLDEIEIRSITPENAKCERFNEDFEIATEISNYFNFKLNNTQNIINKNPLSLKNGLNISFYLKLGFHNEMYTPIQKTFPIFSIGGYCGELLRSYWTLTENEFITNQQKHSEKLWKKSSIKTRNKLKKSIEKIIRNSVKTVNNIYKKSNHILTDDEIIPAIYKEGRARNHFGKACIESFQSNRFKYSPLCDAQLHKLKINSSNCSDKNLLISIILDRYYPLLDFKFDNNRYIDEKTIEYAKNVNKNYPAKKQNILKKEQKYKHNDDKNSNIENQLAYLNEDAHKFTYDLFKSKRVKDIFIKLYGWQIYYKIDRLIKRSKYYPLRNSYPVLAIVKAYSDVLANEYFLNNPDKIEEFKNKDLDILSHMVINEKLYKTIKKESSPLYKFYKKVVEKIK